MRLLAPAAPVVLALLLLAVPAAAQGTGTWRVTSFRADYTIAPDSTVSVVEELDVDFGIIHKHGIFRYLFDRVPCGDLPTDQYDPPEFSCPGGSDRVYRIHVTAVQANGSATPFDVSEEDDRLVIQIGDEDKEISGTQSYRIEYTVTGALNPFAGHDELYWNATGEWRENMTDETTVTVHFPGTTTPEVACFQGLQGSKATCSVETSPGSATYRASRALGPREQLSFVLGIPKGVVTVPPPLVEDRLSVDDFFTLDLFEFVGMGTVAVASLVLVLFLWWRHGRDRRYRSLYYLTNDPTEETRPLFGHTDIVVEYLPPDDLRPAQVGLILDERADPLDVTATVIDLAVRGYLHITEIPKKGWLGKRDWQLDKVKDADDGLQDYEQRLLTGLFTNRESVKLSALKNTFAARLKRVQEALYKDGMSRHWFSRRPDQVKVSWLGAGIAMAVVGVVLCVASGYFLGRALMPAPLVPAGVLLAILSRAMSRRTATGSEALRRVLGFRLYVATAETRMQEFNEQQNIFARYLPYAIVFGCVDKWARAFRGIEDQAASSTVSWYSGVGPFQVMAFSSGLQGFSTSVASTISSTPGSSGGSGFSGGGFSGGGGGGGGGGSW